MTSADSTIPHDAASGRETLPDVHTLEDLAALRPDQLAELYRSGRTPRIESLSGSLRGKMLSIVPLPGFLAAPVRVLAASPLFPWRGKTFRPRDESGGRGVNRVLSDQLEAFGFETSIGKSRAGDFDAMHLNYDLAGNPPVVRSVRDEIREVADGLWLGQAYLRIAGKAHLVLYFALSNR